MRFRSNKKNAPRLVSGSGASLLSVCQNIVAAQATQCCSVQVQHGHSLRLATPQAWIGIPFSVRSTLSTATFAVAAGSMETPSVVIGVWTHFCYNRRMVISYYGLGMVKVVQGDTTIVFNPIGDPPAGGKD